MSLQCFASKYLITKISMYLNPNEIISFSRCNKTIKMNLSSSNNDIINNLFFNHVSKSCFKTEEEDYELDKINNQNEDNLFWKSNINWKLYMNSIFMHFKSYPDISISKMVLDSFRNHMFLPDLRKENSILEFSFNSLHQIVCYDLLLKEKFNYKFYGKYIDNNYINNHGNGCSIKILKEGNPFEKELKQFINTYDEIISNTEYNEIINSIIAYDFEKLEEMFENLSNINNVNNVIYFVLWLNKSFIMHCMYILESITKYENDKNIIKFINEYICQYNNYTNSSLLINYNFENVNLIINYLSYFTLHKNTSDKFSIYELARKIFKKTVYEKISEKINKKTSILYKIVLNNDINNYKKEGNEIEEMDYDKDMDDTKDTSKEDISLDDSFSQLNEQSEKGIFENILNCILDLVIDKNNGKVINHYKIKLGKEYEELENEIIAITLDTIQEYIINGKKSSIELFQILENLFKFEDNCISFNLKSNTFKFINRTKKRILDQALKFMFKLEFPKISNDFKTRLSHNNNGRILIITNDEIRNKNVYKYDLNEFDEQKKIKIEGKIQEEINKLKMCLYEQNINSYDVHETERFVNEYLENNGIGIVLLMKKMILLHIKEFELYEEKAEQIYHLLGKKGNDNEDIFLKQLIKL